MNDIILNGFVDEVEKVSANKYKQMKRIISGLKQRTKKLTSPLRVKSVKEPFLPQILKRQKSKEITEASAHRVRQSVMSKPMSKRSKRKMERMSRKINKVGKKFDETSPMGALKKMPILDAPKAKRTSIESISDLRNAIRSIGRSAISPYKAGLKSTTSMHSNYQLRAAKKALKSKPTGIKKKLKAQFFGPRDRNIFG